MEKVEGYQARVRRGMQVVVMVVEGGGVQAVFVCSKGRERKATLCIR